MRHRILAVMLLPLVLLVLSFTQTDAVTEELILLDSYALENSQGVANFISAVNYEDGQSFQFTGGDRSVSSAKFELYKEGSPVGVLAARVYASTPPLSAKLGPTGEHLMESQPVAMESLGTVARVFVQFTFTGGTTLQSETPYVVSVKAISATVLDASNRIVVRSDATGPTHQGTHSWRQPTTWVNTSNLDLTFEVWAGMTLAGTGAGASTGDSGGDTGFLSTLTNTVTSALSGGSTNGISPVMVIVLAGAAVYLLRPKGKRR